MVFVTKKAPEGAFLFLMLHLEQAMMLSSKPAPNLLKVAQLVCAFELARIAPTPRQALFYTAPPSL